MLPVFGGKIIECQQHIAVLLETLDGLVILGAIGRQEVIEGFPGFILGLRHPDVVQMPFGLGLQAFRHLVQHVGGLVNPAALFARLPVNLAQSLPETQRPITPRQVGATFKAAPFQIEQQFLPTLLAFAIAVHQTDNILMALGVRRDDHQDALPLVIQARAEVDPVSPEIDVALGGQIALLPGEVLLPPEHFQPGNGAGR